MTETRLITLRTLADYLSVSPSTVRRMVDRGDLPKPVKLNGIVRWDRTRVDRLLDGLSANDDYDDPDEVLNREAANDG